ncbi:ABC transporter [Streptomyces sp. HU2014]|uniref:ABC transporter n=1 Tax=Streptomyces albireticuli TaxID=1940 RepID=A0A1Z2KYS1_9ACTN|nr:MULTISPECIES: ABC transporter [Streptomyces]ARZ67176.1 ABC transporter [Streptomyces albireticuli]UQI47240.1 ABC transporter [Streptomyces sp. HU2014]
MTALLRYQAALLWRSHRWLPPLMLYGILMVIGVQHGEPVLDSFGYAAGVLLPVAAWLVRVCVTNEPPAARDCAAAAAGPGRVHLAGILTALGASTVLAAAGTGVVAAIGDPRSADHQVSVDLWPATAAGLAAAFACALLGTAVGALCNRPVLRSTAWAVPSTGFAAILVLFAGGSPARAAVTGLVTGSRSGTVPFSPLPLAGALALTAAAVAVACALAGRRA